MVHLQIQIDKWINGCPYLGCPYDENGECIDLEYSIPCPYIGNSFGKGPSEFAQVAFRVNNKMFVFTMHATRNDFGRYIPTFENMLDSFKAPATFKTNLVNRCGNMQVQTTGNYRSAFCIVYVLSCLC
jgi:hypothetical protein